LAELIYCGRCGKQFSSDAAEKVKQMIVCPPCAAKLNSEAWLPPSGERAPVPVKKVLIALLVAAIFAALAIAWWMGRRGDRQSKPEGPAPADNSP
jgi:hypothetical protein